jgi:hypothetical protein
MNTNSFGFLNTFNTALSGISGSILPSIQTVSYLILTVAFLLGVYEAYFRQGSVRDLAVSLLKTAIAGFVVMNWGTFTNNGGSYSGSGVFPDVYNGFVSIASYISSSYNATDVMGNWGQQFSNFYAQNGVSAWNIFTGGTAVIAGALGYLLAFVGVIFFIIAYFIFTILYSLWGCILYSIGPLLIALMPSTSVNSMAKAYARNLAEWACWPLLYGIFSCLIVAIQKDTVNALLQSTNFSDIVSNTTSVVYLGLMSLVYAVCLLLIPFLAHYVMAADFLGVYSVGMNVGRQAAALILGGAGVFSAGSFGGGASGMGGIGGGGSGHYSGGGGDLRGEGSGSIGGHDRATSMPPSTTPANDRQNRSALRDNRVLQRFE